MIDIQSIRSQFPAIKYHPHVIYFDNASTSQKPQSVLDAVTAYHHSFCSNPHRSTHDWALRSTQAINQVRQQVATFLGLDSTSEIFFTSGATESSNCLALHFCEYFLNEGDEVIVSTDEHKTLLLGWQRAAKLTNKKISFVQLTLDPEGDYNIVDLKKKLTPKTKVVILSHIHNVFGIEMGIKEAREVIPFEVPIILDASQSIGHIPVHPTELGVQAVYFSAHKMFGFSGTGVLWLDKKFRSERVFTEQGTLNIEGILGLGAAIEFIEQIGFKAIEHQLLDLTQYALSHLRQVPDIEFLPGPAFCQCATGHGILSFRKLGVSSQDLAHWLNEHHIYVRAGSHCSLSEEAQDSIRLSFQIYNTREEIDRIIDVLKQV